ncbi:FAD-dependent monooxygenase [Arcticibacterium luteifluviistationis]|uniref:Monooxygenase n=1 Tax=Arcticibacterium luteifluviistationis TaxID=1784714 RepID=A0A2Z4G7F0_9BACT|nr:FAD-dependent monooxygenase [Arcticibacterium luteifluviistationis]AWV97092.1 monooxygenase [Arcticibacterium luteifluviistationis]
MKITIIGAGIGGLTAAIALKQKGFEIQLFEAAPEFKKVGSGINLAINAMQVYKKLGLYDTIFSAGSHTNLIKITDDNLTPLSSIDSKYFEEKYKVKSVAIHRATLHQILLNALSDTPLHLNKKVKALRQSESGIELDFEDGTSHKSSVLIAADGIHSIIRKSIFDDTSIRIAKQICWRGVTKKIELPKKYQTELNEAWGKGKRFGFVAISKNEFYWYALANYKENFQEEFQNIDLAEYYANFHPIVSEIINSTPKENILTNEISDLNPIPNWYEKNICLLGDSAHATTPNLGQGACQAIESSLVLAHCLTKHKSPEKAFKEFEERRIKKAQNVIKTSWRVGKMAHLQNSFLITVRNYVLRNTPKNITSKQSEGLFEIDILK